MKRTQLRPGGPLLQWGGHGRPARPDTDAVEAAPAIGDDAVSQTPLRWSQTLPGRVRRPTQFGEMQSHHPRQFGEYECGSEFDRCA